MTTPRRKDLADPSNLDPSQVARLRAKVFEKVNIQVEDAHKAVMGDMAWTPTQARVFATLLSKVMPDLTVQFQQHEHKLNESVNQLSRADLERIASGVNQIIDVEADTEDGH